MTDPLDPLANWNPVFKPEPTPGAPLQDWAPTIKPPAQAAPFDTAGWLPHFKDTVLDAPRRFWAHQQENADEALTQLGHGARDFFAGNVPSTEFHNPLTGGTAALTDPKKPSLLDRYVTSPAINAGKAGLGAMNYALSPFNSLTETLAKDPAKTLAKGLGASDTGAEFVGNLADATAQVGLPLAGETKIGRKLRGGDQAINAERALAAEKAKPQPTTEPNLRDPKALADQLFALKNHNLADTIDIKHRLEAAQKEITPALAEKMYRFKEGEAGVTLTPEEQALYDTHVAPGANEAKELFEVLSKRGLPPGALARSVDEDALGIIRRAAPQTDLPSGNPYRDTLGENTDYVPRMVAGKRGTLDRTLNETPQPSGSGRRGLSTSAESLKGRNYYAVEGADGERQIAYVDGKKIYIFDELGDATEIGELKTGQKAQPGAKFGDGMQLQTAKTGEIEKATGLKYYKNLVVNQAVQLRQLREAKRNSDFLEELKASPDFQKVAVPQDAVAPQGWRRVGIPQLQGYAFEPKIARALEQFWGKERGPVASALEKTNRLLTGSLFMTPVPHALNVLDHFAISKGVTGWLNPMNWPSAVRSASRATKAVATQNQDYLDMLRSGASLPSAGGNAADFGRLVLKSVGKEIEREPRKWTEIAKIYGYDTPIDLVKGWYRGSSKLLWGANDIMAMTRIYELEEQGMSRAAAIAEAEKHIPNYRIPPTVLGSPALSDFMENYQLFGRYHYGRLKSYGEIAASLRPSQMKQDPAGAMRSLDEVAAMALFDTYVYPALDKGAQAVTGNPDASYNRPGSATLRHLVSQAAQGKLTWDQLLPAIMAPNPGVRVGVEAATNRDTFTGKEIVGKDAQRKGDLGTMLRDILDAAGNQVAPIQMLQQGIKGKSDALRMLEGQFGIKNPLPQQTRNQARAPRYDQRNAKAREKAIERNPGLFDGNY